ncbi:MAG: sialidase family protein [Mycobacteriales bacterium]
MLVSSRWRRAAVLPAVAVFALASSSALAATSVDVQANNPQVAGDPSSNTTARFPTNKQNETTIAVNPLNSQFLVAGANDEQRQPPCGPGPVRGPDAKPSDCSFFLNVGTSGVYTSNDGGATWTNRGLLDDQASWQASPFVSDGDPVLAYGPKPSGNGHFSYANGARVYYATLAGYRDNAGPYPAGKAPEYNAVSYSDDNGVTWSAPVLSSTKANPNNFNDKEWITVDDDVDSKYFGNVYVSWTSFRSASSGNEPIFVTRSTDGGASFDSGNQLSPAGNNGTGNGRQGSFVITGPDGSVYVAFEQGSSQVVAISRNGGVSYSRPITIGAVSDLDDPIPGANFRTNSFPTIADDPRNGSSTLYASWATKTAAGGRVVVSTSTNKGVSWSAPVTVSTPAEGYAFYQGLDVADNGRVDLGYQALKAISTTTYGTGNALIDSYYISKSGAAGSAWTAPTRVSSVSSDPAVSAQNNLLRQFLGDYNQLVSNNTTAWFIYTDTRNGVGCLAVDEYQRLSDGTGTVRGDMGDRIKTRLGQNPYSHEPGSKPAPPEHCATQFGNSDAYVSVITP